MAFIPFDNVVRAELYFRQDGQRVQNVLHFGQPFEPTVATMTLLAEELRQWWATNLQQYSPDTVSLVGIGVTSLNSETAPGIEYTQDLPLVGTSSNDAMPNNVTITVRYITQFRGRNFRGRSYHIGITRNNIDQNTILPVFHDILVAAYSNLLTTANFSESRLTVASRILNGQPRVMGEDNHVVSVSVNTTLDSQRRRLPERGN